LNHQNGPLIIKALKILKNSEKCPKISTNKTPEIKQMHLKSQKSTLKHQNGALNRRNPLSSASKRQNGALNRQNGV
jgi:hypothetical protein